MIRFASLAGAAMLVATAALADQPVLTGSKAFGDWKADRPGVRRLIKPQDLPAPYRT
ncbi:MAG: sorbosone dehydrogenase family protein, partial [Mesorhizobium sp.]